MNGLRNGKGKEYDEGELSYEGDFVDRKRNGKGKEYSFDGDLLFEGEYLDDQNHGKGKEYKIINGESKLIFHKKKEVILIESYFLHQYFQCF